MCVCLRFHLASRLAPLSSSPPCVAAGWHAGWVNRKKKGAKDKQEKEFWLTNLTTYQVYHVHGFAVHVTTILRCLLSPTACCTLSQVKAPKGKPHAPKHVRYAVEGEPHRWMPTGATRGEKYQAGAAYDNDVQVMQRTLESEYEVSLGRVCQHYKVCLAEETQARRELGLALLLVTDVRAYSVQMVLRCGTKNAQSTAAARELFEERYPSSSPRQVATGLIKGVSVCTNCVGAPDWPTEFGDPAAAGLPLANLKGEPLSSGYRPRRTMDQLSAFGAEDIVDMPTDTLQVYCMCCVFPL